MARQPLTDKSTGKRTCEVKSGFPSNLFSAEVLTRIFSFLQGQYAEEFSHRKRLGWITVTHVSRRWRNAALGCGPLWSTIRSGDPDIEDWLNRAGGSPLFVEYTIETAGDEAALTLVLQKLPQIQSLSIRIVPSVDALTYGRVWSRIVVMLSKPAPLLELFELQDKKYKREYPLRLFANTAPALREFKLHGCIPILPAPFLDNLTAFSICIASPQFDQVELLAALGNMHCLEYLNLEIAFTSMESLKGNGGLIILPNRQVVRLPLLKQFTFDGRNFDDDVEFLSHLSFTATTSILFASSFSTPDLSAFPRFIDAYIQARDAPTPILSLQLTWNDRTLDLMTADKFQDMPPESTPPTLGLKLAGPWAEDDQFPTSWVEHLLKLPLANLKHLDTNCELGGSFWDKLSQICTELNYVSVVGVAAYEFIHCLLDDYKRNCPLINGSRPQDNDPDPRTDLTDEELADKIDQWFAWYSPAFCSLQTIELIYMDFEDCQSMIEFLQMALRERENFSCWCVKDIVVTEAENFEMGMVDTLRKVVTVQWDDQEFPIFTDEELATMYMDDSDDDGDL